MSKRKSTKARKVLRALYRNGWTLKRESGSHKTLSKDGFEDYTFAFHDKEEIGLKMLLRIAKHTALTPDDF
ncbi:MAG: type II toxin-antitoxin system HicA family toxin [Planctomycetes bacterium]|nr:type II toxin-antitoxin system HicA family toxin [Planctomycetota bacterium]